MEAVTKDEEGKIAGATSYGFLDDDNLYVEAYEFGPDGH